MISLALSFSKPGSSSEIGEASAPAADGKGAKGAFSAVLASLGPQPASGDGEIAALADEVVQTAADGVLLPAPPETSTIAATTDKAQTAANGTGLPVPAETGKILPDIAAVASDSLPAKAPENAGDGAEIEADGAGTAGAVVAVPLLQLPASAAAPDLPVSAEAKPAHPFTGPSSPAIAQQASLAAAALPAQVKREGSEAPGTAPEADADHSGRRAEAKPAQPFTGQSSPPTAEGSLPPAALLAQAKREGGEKAEAPSVALHVAPEADPERSSRRGTRANAEVQPVRAREIAVEGMLIPRSASAEPAPQAPLATFAQGLPSESTQPGRPIEGAKPAFQADALQDLTRVIDRLAAAREAFAPAATALAIKHADFGELSLRFDQQRNGQLAVQLSASDPDAHRAVAAAVGERGAATTGESHTGTGQSQAQARGAAAERDGNSGNTANRQAERQDPQHRRSAEHNGKAGSGNTPHAGIFA
jgi:hypothetical protein